MGADIFVYNVPWRCWHGRLQCSDSYLSLLTEATDRQTRMASQLRSRGGSYCIAPGCSNELYRTKASGRDVRYHRLPLKRQQDLVKWLGALKRASPPTAPGFRVCSDHFLPSDYEETCQFDSSGTLVRFRTNRLKSEATPSVFDFSGYSIGQTDRPSQVPTIAANSHKERALKRASQAEEREVGYV